MTHRIFLLILLWDVLDSQVLMPRKVIVLDYRLMFNKKILNMSMDNDNATHVGQMRLQSFVAMTTLSITIDIYPRNDKSSKLFTHTINMCNMENAKRSHWLANGYIDYFSQIYDFSIFKCPFKVGNYIYRHSKPIKTISLDMPVMFGVNKSGDVKTTLKGKKVGGTRKLEMMYETTETYMLAEV